MHLDKEEPVIGKCVGNPLPQINGVVRRDVIKHGRRNDRIEMRRGKLDLANIASERPYSIANAPF